MSDKEKDTEFEDKVIKTVEGNAKAGYSIQSEDGWWIGVPRCPIIPVPGMIARYYGRGIGFPVRGIDIDGRECHYNSPYQHEQNAKAEADEAERKRRQEFETNRADYDRRFDALPEAFRLRIMRFRENCPTFRWEYESYELFCCEQAVLIADALKMAEAISEWKKKPWEEMATAVPGISDGHSGNTMDVACGLARLYLQSPASVPVAMGAMVPLVGSVAYGDI